jgi:hypothetical protein
MNEIQDKINKFGLGVSWDSENVTRTNCTCIQQRVELVIDKSHILAAHRPWTSLLRRWWDRDSKLTGWRPPRELRPRRHSGGVPRYHTHRPKSTIDSSRSSTNRKLPSIPKPTNLQRYYNPSDYSSLSGPELKSSPISSPTSAYVASSGSPNAKHREISELELASQRRARSRARFAKVYQDVKEVKRDSELFAYALVTGRINSAEQGIPVYKCYICRPMKVWSWPLND